MRLLFILVLFIPLHAFAKDDLWNGWYVGAATGKQKTDVDAVWHPNTYVLVEELQLPPGSEDREDDFDAELNFIDDETIDSTLFKVGHYWNRQPWILGLEFNYFNNSLEEFETSLFTREKTAPSWHTELTTEFGFSVEPLWALMGKVGYLIQDDLLVYGLLGATQIEINGVAKYSRQGFYYSDPLIPVSASYAGPNNKDLYLTTGIGLEYHLASSWSVNAEYRLVNMSETVTPTNGEAYYTNGGDYLDHVAIDDLSSLTMGINYHF